MKRVASFVVLAVLSSSGSANAARLRGGGRDLDCHSLQSHVADSWCQADCTAMVAAFPTFCAADGPGPAGPLALPSAPYDPVAATGARLTKAAPFAAFPAVPALAFLDPRLPDALAGEIKDQSWRDGAGLATVQGYIAKTRRAPVLFDGTAVGAGPTLPLDAYAVVGMPLNKAEADAIVAMKTDGAITDCAALATLPASHPAHSTTACTSMEQLDVLRLKDAAQLAGLVSDRQFALMERRGQLARLRAALTDADAAEANLWQALAAPAGGGQPLHLFSLVKRVDAAACAKRWLPAFDGATEAQRAEWTALAAAGKLYGIDVLSSAALPKRAGPSGRAAADVHSVGALVLLERRDFGSEAMRPVAIELQQAKGEQDAVRQYTRAGSTDSAWAQSIYFATSAIQNWGVWNGHVLNLHMIPAALTWTARNSLAPEHPVRVMFEDRSGDNLSLMTIFASGKVIDGTPTVVKDLADVLAIVQAGGMPTDAAGEELRFPRDYEPVVNARKNGVLPRDFAGKTAQWWQRPCAEDWSDFPVVAVQQKIWDVAKKYVHSFVDAVFADDAAVAGDAQIAAWVTSAREEGNLKTLEDVRTKAALEDLLTYVVYTPLTHTFSNTDAVQGALFHAGVFHPMVMTSTLPDAAKTYDEAYLLANVLPSAFALKKAGGFFGAFMYSAVNDRLIPKSGELDTELEFPTLAKTHPVNVAQVQLRQDMLDALADVMDNYNPGFCTDAACREAAVGRLSENTSW